VGRLCKLLKVSRSGYYDYLERGDSCRSSEEIAPITRVREIHRLNKGVYGSRRTESNLVHHSDQGVQYVCHAYQQLLAANSIIPSMSRKGDCWDNAVAESFFSTLKTEHTHHRQSYLSTHLRRDSSK
jgi:putative transposase